MISTLKNGCWASVFIWKVFIISSSLLWIVLSSTAYTCLFVTDNFNCISRDPKRIVGVLLSCLWSEWRRFHHQVILIVEMWQRINAEKISFYSYAYIYVYVYIYTYTYTPLCTFTEKRCWVWWRTVFSSNWGILPLKNRKRGSGWIFINCLFKDLM